MADARLLCIFAVVNTHYWITTSYAPSLDPNQGGHRYLSCGLGEMASTSDLHWPVYMAGVVGYAGLLASIVICLYRRGANGRESSFFKRRYCL